MSRLPAPRAFAYSAAACFFAYVVATTVQTYSDAPELSTTELFGVGRHLLVLSALSACLCVRPKFGSFMTATWGLFVPFERYREFVVALTSGSDAQDQVLPWLYVSRMVLLMLGTVLSAIVSIRLYAKTDGSQPESTNANVQSN